jgi:serine/threonine protein kinase/Tfp pilus assembly protein PilF
MSSPERLPRWCTRWQETPTGLSGPGPERILSDRVIGRTLGHYAITARLGAGGMGEVYRATDGTLGREVALKILPPSMATDPTRLERFAREARAVAALNHPHIVTIHSTEEADGVRFFTMELVEGQTLDRLIPSEGMVFEELLAIALQVADALTAAHDRRVMHRDLKPSNVMIDAEGRVKVLDFGLAKMADDPSSDTTLALTRDGYLVGTIPYMSPEQVAGRAVDARTDVFSFGILLYEMATGHRPFQGHSSAELVAAILRDTVPAVSVQRDDWPAGLDRIVRRCLEKDPRDRFQTPRDVFNELRYLREDQSDAIHRASASATAPIRIAHGPSSSERALEAYDHYLRARNIGGQYATNLYQALEQLERAVDLDPELAVAWAGTASTYISLTYTAAIRPREGMPKAEAAAQRALELDPNLAEAHCAHAHVNLFYKWNWGEAERRFLRALELSPDDPQSLVGYGHYYCAFVSHRLEEGIEICRRGTTSGYPLHGLVCNLLLANRMDEAIAIIQPELARNPATFHLRRILGMCYARLGKHDAARAEMEEAVRASGRHPWALFELGWLHATEGRAAEADAIRLELIARSAGTHVQRPLITAIAAALGRTDEALDQLRQAITDRDGLCIATAMWPTFEALWNDTRFVELLKRAGLGATIPRR